MKPLNKKLARNIEETLDFKINGFLENWWRTFWQTERLVRNQTDPILNGLYLELPLLIRIKK